MILYHPNEEIGIQPETTKKDGVSQPAICFVLNYSDLNQRNNKLVDVGFYRKAYHKCK